MSRDEDEIGVNSCICCTRTLLKWSLGRAEEGGRDKARAVWRRATSCNIEASSRRRPDWEQGTVNSDFDLDSPHETVSFRDVVFRTELGHCCHWKGQCLTDGGGRGSLWTPWSRESEGFVEVRGESGDLGDELATVFQDSGQVLSWPSEKSEVGEK